PPYLIVLKYIGFRSEFLFILMLSGEEKWGNSSSLSLRIGVPGAMNQFVVRIILLPLSIGLTLFVASSGARADLEFASSTVDVGEVRAGSTLSHKFTFTNRGMEEVEITGVQSSCGCLTPRMSGQRFAAGEQGHVQVEINTLSPSPGPHTWQVKLSCKTGD